MPECSFIGVRDVNRLIDGLAEAERALLTETVDGLVERVLSEVTDFADWVAAARNDTYIASQVWDAGTTPPEVALPEMTAA